MRGNDRSDICSILQGEGQETSAGFIDEKQK